MIPILLIIGLLMWCGATQAAQKISGQAIVEISDAAGAGHVFRAGRMQIVDSIPELGVYLIALPGNSSYEAKRNELLSSGSVSRVEPNYRFDLLETQQMSISFPDDDVPVHLHGEEPASYYSQPAVYNIGLDSAQLLSDGSGVRIAVVDNGVDRSHPLFADLPDSMSHDFVDKDSDPSEVEGVMYGHGTFVAGLVRLAAPGSELVVVRAFDSTGTSNSFIAAQAINWAINRNADVINLSFGTLTDSPVLAQACQRAIDNGVALVAAAGNAGLTDQPVYPAAYPGVIAVAAIDNADLIAPFSNGFDGIDISAPGVDLYSALAGEYQWGTWSGTSFSAPLVAAVCGLTQSVDHLAPLDLEAHIRATAATELAWGTVITPDLFYGYGRIDAYNAVICLCLGDMNHSGALEVSDLDAVVEIVISGAAPDAMIMRQADLNRDGIVNQADIDCMTNILFGGNSTGQ